MKRTNASSIRIAIVGARRTRMGLGPFVAREIFRAGESLVCVVGTSAASVAQACADLRTALGVEVRGYAHFDDLLAAEDLDAVAILSPSETHGLYLRKALAANLDVLCEKPLLGKEPNLREEAKRLLTEFSARKLVLRENCLWPYTLSSYYKLFPEVRTAPITHFEMKLAPTDTAAKMLGELLSHPLSLLQAIAPADDARIEAIQFSHRDEERPDLELAFCYVADRQRIAVRLRFEQRCKRVATQQTAVAPIPEVGFGINGQYAARRVDSRSYRMSFVDAERAVELPDPLAILVADFLAAVRTRDFECERAQKAAILQRQFLLLDLLEAFSKA